MRGARPGRRAVEWGVRLGLGLLLLGPQPASGRERPQVALTIDDCVTVEREQVRHLLSLELGGPLADGATAAATRAAVTCLPPAHEAPPATPGPQLPAGALGQQQPAGVPGAPLAAGTPGQQQPAGVPGAPLPTGTPGPQQPAGAPGAPLPTGAPDRQQPDGAPGPRLPDGTPVPPPPAETPGSELAAGALAREQSAAASFAHADLVELRVDDAVTGKSLWRSIELQKADPGVRARLLSLALSELIFASWAELLVTPEPAVPAATPAASAAARQATSVQVERKLPRAVPPLGVQLSGLGAAFVLWDEPSVCFGGGARATGDHRYHLGWDLDVLLQHGATATVLGTVNRDLVSARAALLFHQRVPYLTLRGGLGARFGAAKLAGEPADAKTTLGAAVWGPWGGPLLTLGLSAAAARVRLDLSIEAGYVVSPVAARVGGVRAVALDGTWFGIQLGLGSFLR